VTDLGKQAILKLRKKESHHFPRWTDSRSALATSGNTWQPPLYAARHLVDIGETGPSTLGIPCKVAATRAGYEWLSLLLASIREAVIFSGETLRGIFRRTLCVLRNLRVFSQFPESVRMPLQKGKNRVEC
jgi:hypothetical protein